ncbi:MAG: hypothetical protein Fur0041_05370 [Bacteroidia bacterium]
MKKIISLFAGIFLSAASFAQQIPFAVELEPMSIPNMPGLHSFAWAEHNGLWLIIGGRTNGLHGFQPNFAFPQTGQNSSVYVVDPVAGQVWSASLNALNVDLKDQLISSNMQFYQDSAVLLFSGGYGYSNTAQDHITFPNLTLIDVPGLIGAVQNNLPIQSYFRQIADQRFAVTGGHMGKIGNRYLVAFGHRFDGRYNPHNGPSFTQTYTEEIRWFEILDNGLTFTVQNYVAESNPVYYHRRDYNMSPKIFPNGDFGYTGFTGVFRADKDWPHFNSVQITSNGGQADSSFQQLYNQYHTANVSIFDTASRITHTLFFGGMGMYYNDVNGLPVQDTMVPFVKTVSAVSSGPAGSFESVLPVQMPGYQGSAAEFIPASGVPQLFGEVVNLNMLDTGRVLIGYIVGGIESDQPNIFMQTTGSSWAVSQMIKVYVHRGTMSIQQWSEALSALYLYPNPASSFINISFSLKEQMHVKVAVYDLSGRLISVEDRGEQMKGDHRIQIDTAAYQQGAYILQLNIGDKTVSRQIQVIH